ncbi:sterile alpha motif domain-containing protein 1-like [Lutra lutra]|uniref:sterile alpha motif domain-containing protein 1-like n=1 Tax=Lutra lutra TaxID=9657 RepID=UPI001FD16D27|nr:sterile alpha motif domain-containing protein 1-like [Lutra lutra]
MAPFSENRIFAITPHLSSCEREPGTSEILARGAIGSGVPRSGDGGGGGGGGSSDLWSASAAQSCQVLLTIRGRRRRDCDGGVAQPMILARTPGLNPASLRPRLRQRELGRSHGGPSPPSHPSRTPASQGGGPGECRAASLTRTARSSLPLGRPSPPPPPHPPAERAGPPASYPVRGPGPASALLRRAATRIWEASPAHGAAGVGPTCEARASGSPGAATRLRGPHNQPGLSECVAAAAGSGRQLTTAPRRAPPPVTMATKTPSTASCFPGANPRRALFDAVGGAKMGKGSEG